ncbi:BRCT domain-containing protein [Paraburkholderia sp. EG304]|uniref:BRCT domain-containing protein n=1 Tax=Paraburkholderia sp. EG304 TaxID=3237015 RepID=UPI00397D70D9
MSTIKDNDGQPVIRGFRATAVTQRKIDELLGIIKGVLVDGVVSQGEAEYLLNWMQTNREAANVWPASVIYPRIADVLADGVLDLDESKEILDLLMSTVGGNTAPNIGEASNSTKLPVTDPAPRIEFADRTFCFTGKFFSGSRDWCREQVTARGGIAMDSITKKLHYLVIGEIGSRDWLHSTFGTKIQKAATYASDGAPLVIVTEQHWVEHLDA